MNKTRENVIKYVDDFCGDVRIILPLGDFNFHSDFVLQMCIAARDLDHDFRVDSVAVIRMFVLAYNYSAYEHIIWQPDACGLHKYVAQDATLRVVEFSIQHTYVHTITNEDHSFSVVFFYLSINDGKTHQPRRFNGFAIVREIRTQML